MVAQKIFVSCLIALVLFNFIFYVSGLNPDLLSAESLIGIFIALALIAVIASIIPTVSAGGTVSWFLWTAIMAGLFYSVSFDIQLGIFSRHIIIGFGLASHLTEMFVGDINNVSFIPWLFFTTIGLIGVISGIVMAGGGND